MNIVLIGFMGAGKSTVAKLLSKKLNKNVIEMDDLILKESNKRTINEIFELVGEIGFREIEVRVAKDIVNIDNKIISTGGGVIMNQLNMLYLKRNSKIFFLKQDFNFIKNRISNFDKRPLFKDIENAKRLFDLRAPIYEYYADEIIKEKTSEQAVNKIIELLNNI